jgi:hypothetical protein
MHKMSSAEIAMITSAQHRPAHLREVAEVLARNGLRVTDATVATRSNGENGLAAVMANSFVAIRFGEEGMRDFTRHLRPTLPQSLTLTTDNGDTILLFRLPRDVRVPKVRRCMPGISVIGSGGIVVLPSRLRGRDDHGREFLVVTDHDYRVATLDLRTVVKLGGCFVEDQTLQGMMLADAGKGVSLDPADLAAELLEDDIWMEAMCALTVIDPDIGDGRWFHIGCALIREFGERGAELWDDWSRHGRKYDPRKMPSDIRRAPKYRGFNIETVFFHADASDPSWRVLYHEKLRGQS